MEEAKGITKVIKSNLEAKEKECQKLEQGVVTLRKELESCNDELKLRKKYDGGMKELDEMLSKQKHSKDTKGVGYDVGQCSTSKDTSKKEIQFASSSDYGNKQTFTVRNAPRKKIDLTINVENMKMKVVVDPKEKGKLNEDGFIKDKETRINFRRPLARRRTEYVASHKTNQVWRRKGSKGRTIANS